MHPHILLGKIRLIHAKKTPCLDWLLITVSVLAACAADPGILHKAGAEKREERREKREIRTFEKLSASL